MQASMLTLRSVVVLLSLCWIDEALAGPSHEVMRSWQECHILEVTLGAEGTNQISRFKLLITPQGDSKIEILPGTGKLMILSGLMLAQGMSLASGFEVDELDAPVLALQLVEKLLAIGTNGAPSSAATQLAVDFFEPTEPLTVATMSAAAIVHAPWHLRGAVDRLPSGPFRFKLSLEFNDNSGSAVAATYSGIWDNTSLVRDFPAETSILGWKQFRLVQSQTKQASGTAYDYRAVAVLPPYATIGDLRSAEARTLGSQAGRRPVTQ